MGRSLVILETVAEMPPLSDRVKADATASLRWIVGLDEVVWLDDGDRPRLRFTADAEKEAEITSEASDQLLQSTMHAWHPPPSPAA